MELVAIQTNYGDYVNVASAKKECIENVIKQAALCKQISAIILFGSSLEERCTNRSDIDLAIISETQLSRLFQRKSYDTFSRNVYSFDWEQGYDILYFKSIEEIEKKQYKVGICNELVNKGKIIYKRKEEATA